MMRHLGRGHKLASGQRLARGSRYMEATGAQLRQRLASMMSLSIVWLLVSHNGAGLVGCGAAPRAGDFDNKQQQQQQQELSLVGGQLAADGQLESAPDATRRLVSLAALSRAKLASNHVMGLSCKKLIDNYRELLLSLGHQQQSAPIPASLDTFAVERAEQQRMSAGEEALRLWQLIGPDYETAEESLQIDKKAGAKHTPRFG